MVKDVVIPCLSTKQDFHCGIFVHLFEIIDALRYLYLVLSCPTHSGEAVAWKSSGSFGVGKGMLCYA